MIASGQNAKTIRFLFVKKRKIALLCFMQTRTVLHKKAINFVYRGTMYIFKFSSVEFVENFLWTAQFECPDCENCQNFLLI